MLGNVPLLPKENNAVINSVLQAIFDQYGSERPDYKFCDKLAEVLKVKLPATFRLENTVQSPLGNLALPKYKGQGGYASLSKRLGDNFYNRMIRPNIKRPGTASVVDMISPKRQKGKKGYCLTTEKWNIHEGATKAEREAALAKYRMLVEASTGKEKKSLIDGARVYIQKQFKSLEPSQAVEEMDLFWEAGPEILSHWFEWLTGGSKLGSLAANAAEQLNKVMKIVEEFLIDKKGEACEKDMVELSRKSKADTGNDILYKIFLTRSLAQLFKNNPKKVIFLDGVDDEKSGPEEKDPNLFITTQSTLGIEDFEKKVSINLRIGSKILFKDISLPEAFAGMIQIYFSFNLLYPPEADDILQFIERIICGFGSRDGARNQKSLVKKGYRDFEVHYNNL